MATKTINELQLISSVTDGVNLPGDNGVQTYRMTAAQIKAYILANGNITTAMLNSGIIHGLTSVIPALDDYVAIADTSDSNNIKKGLISDIKKGTYRSVSSTDNVTTSDDIIALSGASFTLTLPTAVGVAGRTYQLIHLGTSLSQVYTLATTSSQTIGGIASGVYALHTNGEKLLIVSDGANWQILDHFTKTPVINAGALTIGSTGTPPTKATTKDYDEVLWFREGRFANIYYRYGQTTLTGSAVGTGVYLISLPSNMTLDTTVHPTSGGSATPTNAIACRSVPFTGTWLSTSGGLFTVPMYCIPYSSTQFFFGMLGTSTTYQWGAAGYGLDTSMGIVIHIKVAISGWQP